MFISNTQIQYILHQNHSYIIHNLHMIQKKIIILKLIMNRIYSVMLRVLLGGKVVRTTAAIGGQRDVYR